MVSLKVLANKFFFCLRTTFKRNISGICVHEEVRQALFETRAVIALESTIITHGMEFPCNFKTACEVEAIIRKQGAVPATIAVLNGQIKVGLSKLEVEELSQKQSNCLKISRRDYPYVISHRLTGGTTVSGTIIIAHKVGIPIFVTGGIGGVHIKGETSMDISADLTELGRTPVAVFSSGVKSILDIERTLEYLETQGVAVATYGPSKTFPEFFCRGGAIDSPYNLESDEEAAEFIETIFSLKLGSGILIGVPVPEKYSLNETVISEAIRKGLRMAEDSGIKGKNVTPFLLRNISEITEGKSLKANIALIKNNALIGSRIAVKHTKLRRQNCKNENSGIFHLSTRPVSESGLSEVSSEVVKISKEQFNVVVVGAINLDFMVNITDGGIRPKAVFFTCIDSRMIPTRFTETCVGDMFVVRNAGNIIPHSRFYPDEITTNEPAALELGCVLNDVRHIIVCGHSDCKAMNLLYSLRDKEYANLTNKRISPLRAWMCAHASSSLERFLKMEADGPHQPLVFHGERPLNKFVAYIDADKKFRIEDRLSQVHTLEQLQNIASYGFLRTRLEQRDLHVHALWFDIYTGEVYYFSRSAKRFVEINENSIMQLLKETDGRTVVGRITQSGGGVGRNIADALGKLQINPLLISAIGEEEFGTFIMEKTIPHLNPKGITKLQDISTGTCVVFCDQKGECLFVVGDMDIHDKINAEMIRKHESAIANSALVILDGNINQETLEFVLGLCRKYSVPVWYEPTDYYRAHKPFINKSTPKPFFISPNRQEFLKIYETIYSRKVNEDELNNLEAYIAKAYEMTDLIDNIIITMDKEGVLIIRKGESTDPFYSASNSPRYIKNKGPVSHRIYKPKLVADGEMVNVSGAGDCFASGFVAAMLKGKDEKSCIEFAFKCSNASLKSSKPVPLTFF